MRVLGNRCTTESGLLISEFWQSGTENIIQNSDTVLRKVFRVHFRPSVTRRWPPNVFLSCRLTMMGGRPQQFAWKGVPGAPRPSRKLIGVGVHASGEVRGVSSFKGEDARCPWTPSTPHSCPQTALHFQTSGRLKSKRYCRNGPKSACVMRTCTVMPKENTNASIITFKSQ